MEVRQSIETLSKNPWDGGISSISNARALIHFTDHGVEKERVRLVLGLCGASKSMVARTTLGMSSLPHCGTVQGCRDCKIGV